MTDKDDDLESGLGHDPLEWLQDDEDSEPGVICTTAENPPSTDEVQPPPTATESAPQVAAESDTVTLPEPVPMPESEAQQKGADAPQQSYRYDNHKAFVTLPEKLSVQVVEPMHSEWKTLLYDLPQSVEIDASITSDIDTAGLQLFYALVQQLAYKGVDVVIVSLHPNMQRQISLFGLTAFFAQYELAA